MRVLILGGYGFIGLSIARRLHAAGHDVTGLGRSESTGGRLFPRIHWASADISLLDCPEAWRAYLRDIDVVVNASGALQDSARDNLKAVHDAAIAALIAACEESEIQRFVQISAPGAEADATTEFMRSKSRGDDRLKRSSIDWVILRPGLVIGPGAYGGTALIRMLAGFPIVQPLMLEDRKLQTVALSDVVEIALQASEGDLPARSDFDLVEPEAHTLRHVVEQFREWLGVPPARAWLILPKWVGHSVAKIADILGRLGWRSPLRSTAMRVIGENVLGDPKELRAITGRELSALDQTLEAMPATLQERWFARLYLAMPLTVATLSAFWFLSGVVALLNVEVASAVLLETALSPLAAQIAVIAGAILDIALGAAILYRPWSKIACLGMVATTLIYLTAGTVLTPGLWSDPLGPFIKTLPAMMLALTTIILLEER